MKNIQISISIMKWPVNITTMNGMTKIFLNIYMGHGGIANMFSGFTHHVGTRTTIFRVPFLPFPYEILQCNFF